MMGIVGVASLSLSVSPSVSLCPRLSRLHAIPDPLTLLSRHTRDSAHNPLHPHRPSGRWQQTNRSDPELSLTISLEFFYPLQAAKHKQVELSHVCVFVYCPPICIEWVWLNQRVVDVVFYLHLLTWKTCLRCDCHLMCQCWRFFFCRS